MTTTNGRSLATDARSCSADRAGCRPVAPGLTRVGALLESQITRFVR